MPGNPSSDLPDSEFWRFSLTIYGRPDVPEACLRLQDECGVDVNVLLYLLFLARSGRLIDAPDLDRIEALVTSWRDEAVVPLRGVRRFLKSPPPNFRDEATERLRAEIKRVELEAERLQQLALERALPVAGMGGSESDRERCVVHNLGVYAARRGGFPDQPVAVLRRRLADI